MEAVKRKATSSEPAAVVAVALDYFEGWFDGDEARMERALHPNFVKRRAGEELGNREYLHLVRTGDGSKIANALWQLT